MASWGCALHRGRQGFGWGGDLLITNSVGKGKHLYQKYRCQMGHIQGMKWGSYNFNTKKRRFCLQQGKEEHETGEQ